jgi:hypothetical protein
MNDARGPCEQAGQLPAARAWRTAQAPTVASMTAITAPARYLRGRSRRRWPAGRWDRPRFAAERHGPRRRRGEIPAETRPPRQLHRPAAPRTRATRQQCAAVTGEE